VLNRSGRRQIDIGTPGDVDRQACILDARPTWVALPFERFHIVTA
jgi:hypothetical protein